MTTIDVYDQVAKTNAKVHQQLIAEIISIVNKRKIKILIKD